MPTVVVNPPRTPVTAGSGGVAAATLPNVCKMPGPPAPFVPTPLPNVARSSIKLRGGTKTVKFDGKAVAVKGASFGSTGDMASKATGGGLVSANVHGEAKFTAPGSMNVKAEGKNIHLLGDAMTNNNGNPPNAATLPGLVQWSSLMVRGLEKGIADALCDAACKALGDRGRSRTTQSAMAKVFAKRRPPFYRPKDPRILPEVSQWIPADKGGGMETLLSTTGATVGKRGPTAPMSMMKAMRRCPRGTMTRWDFVIPTNPSAPVANANIKHYIEVKFPNDKLTDNQLQAREKMTDEEIEKIVDVNPIDDCVCTKSGGLVTRRARQRPADAAR